LTETADDLPIDNSRL